MATATVMNLPELSWTKGIGPGIVDKKIVGPGESSFMLMSVAKMATGVKSPPHRHKYAQIFYFLEGRGKVVVGGDTHEVSPGSVLKLLKGEEHTVINDGPGELTLLEVRVLPRGSEVWE